MDEFYYLTVMNENIVQPPMPDGVSTTDLLSGLYRLPAPALAPALAAPDVRLVGSGMILQEVIAAAERLARDFGLHAEVYSATSFTELAREARDAQRHNRLQRDQPARQSRVQQLLGGTVPVLAATDYVRAVPQLVAEYIGAPYTTLGTDGFGRSGTRRDVRRFFEVDREHICSAALHAIANANGAGAAVAEAALAGLGLQGEVMPPWER